MEAALAHLTLDELLDELLERVRAALDADTAAILILDEEANELAARAAKGIEEEVEQGVRIPLGAGFAGRVAAERRSISIENVDEAQIYNPILREKGIKSLLGTPLIARGKVLGVLHVGTLTPHRFDSEEIELLEIVAERVSQAIDHGLLFEEAREAQERAEANADRLRKVQEVTEVAIGDLTVEDLLDEFLVRVRTALGADTAAILLLDEKTNELVAKAAKGIEEEVERGVRIPVGQGFAGRVAATRQSVAIEDVEQADVSNPILREKGIKSLLGTPLISRGRVLGVMHVGTLTTRIFSPEDKELLEIVAERVAVALERSLVHEELLSLDNLKREFISIAAHEVRTPATVIYGVAETLARRGRSLDPSEVDALVDAFYDASVRLARLTEELLDYSRVENYSRELRLEPLNLRAVISQAVLGLSAHGDRHIENMIPDAMTITSDREALERIVANLVGNALVHGAPPVRIGVAESGNGSLRITVTDQGPGVEEGFVPHLFDPFSRSAESSGKPGAGLGLAIALSYTRRLGGELRYAPGRPKGATFTLELPAS
jgi:signal transduction histidine kinase/BMFP domain-containing protein YqiC